MSTKSVVPSNHLILCCSLLFQASVFASIRVFSSKSALRIRWLEYWSFSFSISPSNVYSGLISFTIDWFDLLAVQGTLKSLLQHHSSKASNSMSFSLLYGPTLTSIPTAGKTIALIIWTFLGKVKSLLFNMLSRFAIAFLPRSKCLCLYFCQIGSSVLFFKIPHVCINIQQLYFSFILHCIWHSLGSSMSLQITQFCSFLRPSSIPLSICITSSLSFICWQTLRLLPYPGCCKECCSEHWDTWVFLNYGSLRIYVEKAMAPHSSTLAWKVPWMEEPGRLKSMGSLGVGDDWVTSLSLFTFTHWRRKWQPTPVFLPRESQGRGSLVGCCLWGFTESDTTEATEQQQQQQQQDICLVVGLMDHTAVLLLVFQEPPHWSP